MKVWRITSKRVLSILVGLAVVISSIGVVMFAVSADDMQGLTTLYNEWKDEDGAKYISSTYSALQKALNNASFVLEGEDVIENILDSETQVQFAGKNSTGENETFFTVEDFKSRYPNYANKLPFAISAVEDLTKISLNDDAIGFYHPDDTLGRWGNPMIKYNLSDAPVEVDFSKQKLSVDVQWTVSGKNANLPGSVCLFFENIGEWIELSTIASSSVSGRYIAEVDLSNYYASLDSNSIAKVYLDNNGATDKLLGVVFRFGNIYSSKASGLEINVRDFTLKYELSVDDAIAELQAAVDGLIIDNDAVAMNELSTLYSKYSSEDLSAYTDASVRNLKAAMDLAKSVVATGKADYDNTDLLLKGAWKMCGRYTAGDLLTYYTKEQLAVRHKDYVAEYGYPFSFDDNGTSGKDIVFNKNTIGYAHDTGAPIWGMPMVKFELLEPINVNFNADILTFDVEFFNTDDASAVALGEVDLFFTNLGEYMPLHTVFQCVSTNHYTVTVDLRKYYDSLSSNSKEKKYLDANDFTDKLTGIVFRYQDVWHQTHGCTISVREVSISKPVTTVEEAAQIMKSAADSLVKKDELSTTALEKLKLVYSDASAISQGEYSDVSWELLKKNIGYAKAVISNSSYKVNESVLTNMNNWEFAGKYPSDYSNFHSAEKLKYDYNIALPTEISKNGSIINIVPKALGFYSESSSHVGMPKQRYNLISQNVLVDFSGDKLVLDINFGSAGGNALSGAINLEFKNIGTVSVSDYSIEEIKGSYKLTLSLSEIYDKINVASKKKLVLNNGIDTLKYIEISWNESISSIGPSISISQMYLDSNIDVETAIYRLNYSVNALEKAENQFVFDNVGRWYFADPASKNEKYIPQKENQEIVNIIDQRNVNDKNSAYYRIAFMKKGLCELENAVGTYKLRYDFMSPISLDFNKDALYLDIHATYVGQENQDVRYYIDLYVDGYSKPVRLSSLYSNNSGLEQGRTKLTAKLYEFMNEDWADAEFKSFVKKNNGKIKVSKIGISATFDGANWEWGGESILVRDFSIGKAVRPSAVEVTAAVTALTNGEYITSLADRYTIRELELDYGYMTSEEKAKLSKSTVNSYNKLINFINKAEKDGYFFDKEFSDRATTLSTGWTPTNSEFQDMPLDDENAYLDYRKWKGGITVFPTGTTLQKHSYNGGTTLGWTNLWFYCQEPASVSINDTVIYYDVEADSSFAVFIHFNESETPIYVTECPEGENGGVYTGAIDVAALVNALSDDEKRTLGIYNCENIFVTKIRVLQRVVAVTDQTLGHKVNIRTLAISNSSNAYFDSSNYHKVSYKSVPNNIKNFGVSITPVDVQSNYSTVFNELVEKGMVEFEVKEESMEIPIKGENLAFIWWIVAGTGVACAACAAVIIILIVKKRRQKNV